MSILRMCPNSWHIEEFYGGFNGTCTQTSAAMCLASAHGTPTTHDEVVALMLSLTHEMIGRGDNPDTGAAANGAATVKSMAYELRQRGATILTEWDYAGDVMPEDWHTLIHDHAGIHPILLQVANAQGAWDTAGTREDGGVQYHAIALLGIADEGYVVADPNNPTVESTFDIYPYPALVAAEPCGLIMLATHEEVLMAPTGYQDDGHTVTAPNGITITEPIRSLWLQYAAPFGAPLEAAKTFPNGDTEQIFYGTLLGVVGGKAVVGGAGQRMIDQAQQLAALHGSIPADPAQVKVDNLKAAIQAVLE